MLNFILALCLSVSAVFSARAARDSTIYEFAQAVKESRAGGRVPDDYKLGPDSRVQPGVPQGTVTKLTLSESRTFPGTTRYSRTVAFNCALNASTTFACAEFTSASVSVLSAAR